MSVKPGLCTRTVLRRDLICKNKWKHLFWFPWVCKTFKMWPIYWARISCPLVSKAIPIFWLQSVNMPLHHYNFRDWTLWAIYVFIFSKILLMNSSFSYKAIVLLAVQKITAGKMSLTLVHGTGNGWWHIQYQESGRAKYFCQASSFTVKRCGWKVHLGLNFNTAF